jgi:hypothetical protein
MGLNGENQTRRIHARASRPLAPITAFADSETVVIAANEVGATITYDGKQTQYGFTMFPNNSPILGNLKDGSLRSLYPVADRAIRPSVLYDITRDGRYGLLVQRTSRILQRELNPPYGEAVLRELAQASIGDIKHLNVSKDGQRLAFTAMGRLWLGRINDVQNAETIDTPRW